jgi:hypothetical protein
MEFAVECALEGSLRETTKCQILISGAVHKEVGQSFGHWLLLGHWSRIGY